MVAFTLGELGGIVVSTGPGAGSDEDIDAAGSDEALLIEIHDSTGVQVGPRGVQINNIYYPVNRPGDVAPPPLVRVSGNIEFPYRGLQAFEEHDAAVFFGREAAATEILQRLSGMLGAPELLIVSGVSGPANRRCCKRG